MMSRALSKPLWIGDNRTVELERIQLEQKSEQSFGENWLQRLIHDHPSCLPVYEIEPGFGKLVPVCMEFPTEHGPVDNLLMTPDGDIVMVEVKLWRNPQARREVVAQALDYAACIFEMDYSELETAALKGQFGENTKPDRLYDIFPEADVADEPDFIDAVNGNLRRGRMLILVVGDGIRTETERLSESLQSHAGFHFTFGLVELAVFKGPGGSGLLIQPRTLAKTSMIERGIVQVQDQRTVITSTAPVGAKARQGRPENITADQFYEAMALIDPLLPDRIRSLLDRLEQIGVYPEFKRSLNLKWDPPSGKPVNLGYITREGLIWTDASNWFTSPELSHAYIEDLAGQLGGEVEKQKLGGNWHVRMDDKVPRIEAVIEKSDDWINAMERFIEAVRNSDAERLEG